MKTIDDSLLKAPPVNEQYLIDAGMAPSRVGPHNARTLRFAKRELKRLTREPAFREEFHRLRELLGPAQPRLAGGGTAVLGLVPRGPRPPVQPEAVDADELERRWEERRRMTNDEVRAVNERRRQRRLAMREASRVFAQHQRFDYINPDAVAWVLEKALDRPNIGDLSDVPEVLAPEYAGPLPMFYVNPTADRDLMAPVKPGRILVDLTHASTEDLKKLASSLAAVQLRLGYKKPGGGPAPEDRGERCRTFRDDLKNAIYLARDERAERGDSPRGNLSQDEVARMLGWSDDTLRNRIAECGMSWSEARRLPGSRTRGVRPD